VKILLDFLLPARSFDLALEHWAQGHLIFALQRMDKSLTSGLLVAALVLPTDFLNSKLVGVSQHRLVKRF